MATYYRIDIVHNLNSQKLIIQIWNEDAVPGYDPIPVAAAYETQTITKPYKIEKTDANTIKLKVNQTPGLDGRFAGRIVIISIP